MRVQLKRIINYSLFIINSTVTNAQLKWVNVDSLYQPLPSSVHLFKTTDSLDGKPNIAYYVIADLKDKKLLFDANTTLNRRFTPSQFYQKNNQPLVVVNTTFFSFQTNRNLNVVMKDGKLLSFNEHSIPLRGKDTLKYFHTLSSAIGVDKKGFADVAWTITRNSNRKIWASPWPIHWIDSSKRMSSDSIQYYARPIIGYVGEESPIFKWKMQTVVGGGPVLLQNGEIEITNNEERKFAGKAIDDKHPRTAMGYTKDQKLIILVVQGRFPGIAEGATLGQEAKILQDLGCWEALNLDGGGSSCMLVNGKETIKPSDPAGQRAVPAVFIIKSGSKNY